MILLINVGSRFVTHEFSHSDEEYQQNILLRRLTVFAICFVGTRDLLVSILLTAGFVVLASGLFRGAFGREGLTNKSDIRQDAGLIPVDDPAYDRDHKLLFG